jgi:hypothetical protein
VPVEFLVELVDFLADRASANDDFPPKLKPPVPVQMSVKGAHPAISGSGSRGRYDQSGDCGGKFQSSTSSEILSAQSVMALRLMLGQDVGEGGHYLAAMTPSDPTTHVRGFSLSRKRSRVQVPSLAPFLDQILT